MRSCIQGRCNEASRPVAERSGSGLAVASRPSCGRDPCISYALAHCAHLYSRRRSRLCRPWPNGPFTQPGFDQGTKSFCTHTNVAIINSPGATKLRLVAPSVHSALVLSLSLAGHGHRLPVCLLPCLITSSDWSGVSCRGEARLCNSGHRLTHLDPDLPDCTG